MAQMQYFLIQTDAWVTWTNPASPRIALLIHAQIRASLVLLEHNGTSVH